MCRMPYLRSGILPYLSLSGKPHMVGLRLVQALRQCMASGPHS